MRKAKKLCECGRVIRALPHSKHVRKGKKWRAIPGHDLCDRCWRTAIEKQKRNRKMPDSRTTFLENVKCDYDTDMAVHIVDEEGRQFWVPKSLIAEDSEVWKEGDKGDIYIPEWFALQEGMI